MSQKPTRQKYILTKEEQNTTAACDQKAKVNSKDNDVPGNVEFTEKDDRGFSNIEEQ